MTRRPPISTLFPYTSLSRSVARDDDRLQAIARRARGERRHDVVGLVAVDGDDGNMECVQDLAHALERTVEILLQLLAQLFARRSEEHTPELQSPCNLVCRLL